MTTEAEIRAAIRAAKKQVAANKKAKEEAQQVSAGHRVEIDDSQVDGAVVTTLKYLMWLKTQSLSSLMDHFFVEMEEISPTENRDWLIMMISRTYQINKHIENNEEIPKKLQSNYDRMNKNIPASTELYIYPEPESNIYQPPEYKRLIATSENKFIGKKWTRFEIVRMAEDKGVGFKELVFKLKRILLQDVYPMEDRQKKAEKLAQDMFTDWVDEDYCRTEIQKTGGE